MGAKLSRQLKSSYIELLRRRNVGAISRGGAETEKNPGKMVVPVSHSAAGKESGHEMAVEPFHKTVGLGMVGGGRLVRDVEVRAEGNPQGRGELRTAVRGDNIWHTKNEKSSGEPKRWHSPPPWWRTKEWLPASEKCSQQR